MPAYNFQGRFAAAVHSGDKRQTIRRRRQRPTVVGDRLVFYTGMRTPQCCKLGEATCTRVRAVTIDDEGIMLDGRRLELAEAQALARADGFLALGAMRAFFHTTYGFPFHGEIIEW